MMLDAKALLAEANKRYKARKGREDAEIQSDQVKAVLEVLVEAMNHELFAPIVVHTTCDDID